MSLDKGIVFAVFVVGLEAASLEKEFGKGWCVGGDNGKYNVVSYVLG